MASPMEVNDGTEWELSKENVQPLRQGRKMANLAAALQPASADQMTRIREERQAFESELRTYSGDDILEVWDSYIKWTEQNFPKGGKESNLLQILERCVTQFKDELDYKNDPRYISAWIKFAGMCTDPLEIYSFLFNQQIGCKLAQLYEAWAWELERLGNTKKADLVYTQAVQNGAQPLEEIRRRHRSGGTTTHQLPNSPSFYPNMKSLTDQNSFSSELQLRVARRLAGEQVDTPDRPSQEDLTEQSRGALGQLKIKKRGGVSTNRVGSARSRSSQGSVGGVITPASQQGGIQIFCDENAMPEPSLPPQTDQWKGMPSRGARKENEKAPGVWTQARAKQRGVPAVPISEVGNCAMQNFDIHVDADVAQPMTTPRKIQPQVDQILSSKKPEKNPDRFYHVQHQSAEDPTQRPMYCKAKIYSGVEEFSFEELRAARWRERKRKAEMKLLWEGTVNYDKDSDLNSDR